MTKTETGNWAEKRLHLAPSPAGLIPSPLLMALRSKARITPYIHSIKVQTLTLEASCLLNWKRKEKSQL